MYVVTEFNKIFSGSQLQQVVQISHRFRDNSYSIIRVLILGPW